jgi:hypothetical protein
MLSLALAQLWIYAWACGADAAFVDFCAEGLNLSCCTIIYCDAVLNCNECFLEHVVWDSSKTYDVLGPETADKTVVLVHGALIGRHCLVLEARALAEAGFRSAAWPVSSARAVALQQDCACFVTSTHELVLMGIQAQQQHRMAGLCGNSHKQQPSAGPVHCNSHNILHVNMRVPAASCM